jgi:hypothetical protein
MPNRESKPALPVTKRPQTYALDEKAFYAIIFGVFIVYLLDHYMFQPFRSIFRWYNIDVI